MKNILLLILANILFVYNINAELLNLTEKKPKFNVNSTNSKYMSLEGDKVPSNWTSSDAGSLTMTTDHYKLGESSVKWVYQSESSLSVLFSNNEIKEAVANRRGGLQLWIYNEEAVDDKLRFEFTKNGEVSYYFDFGINYVGWRACWISFNEDMSGDMKNKDLDTMTIRAPKFSKKNLKAAICFDRMSIEESKIHHRRTPDAQLPYINPKMNINHWGALHHWEQDYKHDITLQKEVSPEQFKQLRLIEKRINKSVKLKTFTPEQLAKIEKTYNRLGIKRGSFGINGKPFVHKDELRKSEIGMKRAGFLLNKLANIWVTTKDEKYAEMFVNIIQHLYNQGFAYESGLGTNHHYGYEFRLYPISMFMMRDYLDKKNILDVVAKTMCYWSGVQEFRLVPEVGSLQGLVDTWNTTIIPRVMSIMLLKNDVDKIREFKALSRWMNVSLKIVPGTMGGIKSDGCMFHHGGLYPAYGNGGFSGLGKYLLLAKNTDFDLTKESKINLALALNTMKTYTLNRSWGSGLCGRHPLIGRMNEAAMEAFASLAKSGNPYTGEPIWKEMAEAYLSLKQEKSSSKTLFLKEGITAEAPLDGHFTFNYGALGIHRKANWMVVLKGYNRHVWASEIYTRDNRFGRYQSYGTLQILNGRDSECEYTQNGWDWNRFPGATVIHLPLDILESPRKNTLMEKSKQKFAGSSNLNNKIGIFGMILAENKRKNFTKDFMAYKSVFCFDDVVIALGSNISNSNAKYKTETTIFQLSTDIKNILPVLVDGQSVVNKQVSLDSNKDHLINDTEGNYYFFPKGQNLVIKDGEQTSRHNKTKKITKGNFISAWLNHGSSPTDKSYEYVILPQFDGNKKIKNKLKNDLLYKVLQKNEKAHILSYPSEKIISYVFFAKNLSLVGTPVQSVDHASLLILKKVTYNKMHLSLCDPDLNLPTNKYTTKNGSQAKIITLKLFGKWKLDKEHPKCKITVENGISSLIFTCIEGMPVEVKISRK